MGGAYRWVGRAYMEVAGTYEIGGGPIMLDGRDLDAEWAWPTMWT